MTRKIWFLVGATVLATSILGTPVASAAEGEIRALGAAEKIPGSFIVKLKRDGASADALAGRFGAAVSRHFTGFGGFSVRLTEKQARRLAADPAVEYVEANQAVHVETTQSSPPSWGLDRTDQRDLPLSSSYSYTSAGAGVNVYVIDTGVRVSHSAFDGRAVDGYDAVDGRLPAQDGNGHGTHVAGTIAGSQHGVAKAAKIVAVRVLDDEGSGSTEGVIEGIDWVAKNAVKPAVANMSLGGLVSSSLDDAVRKAIAAGVTFTIAAGNSSVDASTASPARVTEAITVGATERTDARATYSNFGSVLDIFAPGSAITSAWNTSDSATNTISGTSMAAPHVAGAAARYLSANPSATPDQVASHLIEQSTPAKVGNPGVGSPNRLLHLAPTA
ncbi:S8 family peptidase [Lentzea rhizosphaerae]|uniref:S8 family peptidase n=1 Tax=Lentzea rhizosphaerae TaxID=2041025 RepID=A0ABV8C194_9PSEU